MTTTGMRSTRQNNIDNGVLAVREWQRGIIEPLRQWEGEALTVKGSTLLKSKLRQFATEEQVRAIVTEAVDAGF